jgi:catechol 2,3-dioxygenase-like lactoylglutathione lyase family enzyme
MARIVQGLAHIRVFSMPSEWTACAAFYRDTLGLDEIYTDPDAGVAVFEVGADLTLGLERVPEDEPDEWELAGRFTGISFRVGDMARAYELYVARGVAFDGPPERMDWGGILAHFSDPAGNTLTLVEEPSEEDLLGAG